MKNTGVQISFSLGTVVLASVLASSAHAGIVETYEAPGVTNTTTTFTGGYGTETFDNLPATSGGFSTNFGGSSSSYTGTYSGSLQVQPADQYGGAGGTGSYAVTFTGNSYSLTLNKTATYFGFWLSALDAGNVVSFYNGQTLVGSLDQTQLLAAIGGNSAYDGNPSPAPLLGNNGFEAYAFINFYGTDGTSFDRVVFSEVTQNAGYESDNHTVGNYATITGTTVPEPSSYALVVLALAGVGATSRRKSNRR